jgi:ADP-L-glycero-D-manno-heptose 6-epimerase
MILVTGGAGFIGSNLQAALHRAGRATVIADTLGTGEKWRNIARHPPDLLVDPAELSRFLDRRPHLEAVVHLGAISDTTARDADLVWRTNVALSEQLLDWCAVTGTPFVYASSAATYGDGRRGFSPDTADLLPLNLYGWSKHVFDRRVAARRAAGLPMPPQCAGLKFFNVYGPNEYHKGSMVSVVKRKWDEVRAGGAPTLFRADRPGIADGEQKRDFVHVDDCVAVILWLLAHPRVSGLFNVGTGQARTYLDLAHAVCDAAGVERRVEFVPMPDALRGQYQSFTEAPMEKLRRAGYDAPPTTLEEGIGRYVRHHLVPPDPYN